MYRAMCLGLCLAMAALVPANAQTVVDRSYGWEDGVGTILGKYGNVVDPTNVTGEQAGVAGSAPDYTCPGAQEGNQYLHVAEQPHSGTPEAYLAYVRNLSEGDVVTASYYGYDVTPNASPSLRIWGHYSLNSDMLYRAGSAGGNDTYTDGTGWGQVSHTWTIPAGIEALVIEGRLYSTPATGETSRTDYWIDNLYVQVTPAGATTPEIVVPGDVIGAEGVEVVTDVTAGQVTITLPSGDPNQATYQIVNGITAVYPTWAASGSLTDPVTSLPVGAGQALSSNQVVYNVGAAGLYEFTYIFTQNGIPSTEGTIRLWVQDVERVVITEIMYGPANSNDDEPTYDSDWEWVEVTNMTESDIYLGTLWDNTLTTTDNIYYWLLPAQSSRVIMKPDRSLFSLSAFETEWGITSMDLTIQMLQAGQEGEPRLSNYSDVLRLFDADGALLDVVSYKSGDGWPTYNQSGSIYLEYGSFSTLDNDDGSNWKLSSAGVCEAWATTGGDAGSPGALPTQICNAPPVAQDGEVNVQQDTSPGVVITLVATDPETDPLTYSIVAGPAAGTLTDPNAGEADVTAGGALAGNEVRYTPAAGDTGDYTFTFKANDTLNDSNVATVTVHVTPVVIPPGVLAKWTFEVSLPTTAGPHSAEEGVGTATGYHAGATTYSNPVGNGSAESFSSSNWLTGDYYEFQTSSLGYTNVEISFDQTRSGTGPTPFDVEISTDGVNWTTLVDDYTVDAVTWSGTTYKAESTFGPHAAPALDNQATIYVRLTAQADASGTGGTCRVDNVAITGETGSQPGEPPVLTAAESVKAHGLAGSFGIDVAAAGAVERRVNGPTSLVVTFDRDIQLVGGANDVVLSGGAASNLAVAGDTLTITMAGAANALPLTVEFPGVADANDVAAVSTSKVCFGVLSGDANGDRSVNIFDLVAVRNALNQPVTAANFRMDVTADGAVNIFDLVSVRNNLNTNVAACP